MTPGEALQKEGTAIAEATGQRHESGSRNTSEAIVAVKEHEVTGQEEGRRRA